MSSATVELFGSTDFLVALAIGSVALLLVTAWAGISRQPVAAGGIALSVGAVVAMALVSRVPSIFTLGIGLAVLALGGSLRTHSLVAAMAATLPGATVVGASFLDSPRPLVIVFVVTAIVVAAPLVASYHESTITMSMPLMVIAVFGVLITVPDTDEAIVIAGAALPWLLAGPPLRLTRLGTPGAYATVGLLIWMTGTGGYTRPGALVAGAGCLGFLVAEPLARRVPAKLRIRVGRARGWQPIGGPALAASQAIVAAAMSQIANASGANALLAGAMTAVIIALAGLLVIGGPDAGRVTNA